MLHVRHPSRRESSASRRARLADADDFREFAASALDGAREVVFDLADLTFLDSTGIKARARLAESACPHGLVLRSPLDNVWRVLDIVRIEDIAGIRVERGSDPGGNDPVPPAARLPRPAGRFEKTNS